MPKDQCKCRAVHFYMEFAVESLGGSFSKPQYQDLTSKVRNSTGLRWGLDISNSKVLEVMFMHSQFENHCWGSVIGCLGTALGFQKQDSSLPIFRGF